jgi:hypothetical protein
MIDIREHGGMYGGGGAGKIEFVKVTWSLTEPLNPKVNDLWIKKAVAPQSVLFDDVKPTLSAGDAFIRVIDKEQVPKASEVKKGLNKTNVTPEAPTAVTPSKVPYVQTDFMDIHGRLGQVYYSSSDEKLDAFLWDGVKWVRISSNSVSLITSFGESGKLKMYDISGGLMKTSSVANPNTNYGYQGIAVNPEQDRIFITNGNRVSAFSLETLDFLWEYSGNYGAFGLDTDIEGNVYASARDWANPLVKIDKNGVYKSTFISGNYSRYAFVIDGIKRLGYLSYTATNYSPSRPSVMVYDLDKDNSSSVLTQSYSESTFGNVSGMHLDKDGDLIISSYTRINVEKGRYEYDGSNATYNKLWSNAGLGYYAHSIGSDIEKNIYILSVSSKRLLKLNPDTGVLIKAVDLTSYVPFSISANAGESLIHPINVDDKMVYVNMRENPTNGQNVYLQIDKESMEVVAAMQSALGDEPMVHTLGGIRNFANRY